MSTLLNEIEKLRDRINKTATYKQIIYDQRDNGNWNKLWSSVDNLEDAQHAIDIFSQKAKIDILDIFGLLQAIYVQQDVLLDLGHALDLKSISYKNHKRLEEIRQIRAETIGHPTNTVKDKSKTYFDGGVSYTSMYAGNTGKILSYMIYSASGNETKEIDLNLVIKDQEELIKIEINKMFTQIDKVELKHKLKFKDNSLENTINDLNYDIQKLYPFQKPRKLSKLSLKIIREHFESFKKGYLERYGENALSDAHIRNPGLVESVKKITLLLNRIDEMVDLGNNVLEIDLEVYVDALRNELEGNKCELEGLCGMAKNIDEEFMLPTKK